MADKKIEIVKVELRLGDKTVSLTLEEARELHRKLGEIFDHQPTYVPYVAPMLGPHPWPYPQFPYITWSKEIRDNTGTVTGWIGGGGPDPKFFNSPYEHEVTAEYMIQS